jgi:hypothetical protein
MAALRNLAIGILKFCGWTNIAQANRHHAQDPHEPKSVGTESPTHRPARIAATHEDIGPELGAYARSSSG